VLLGVLFGIILHFALHAFVLVFDLDQKPMPKPKPIPATGHDAVSYRAAREAKKRKNLEEQQNLAMQARLIASQPLIQEVVREARNNPIVRPLTSPLSPNTAAASRSGLLQETILEHTDEEDEDSVF